MSEEKKPGRPTKKTEDRVRILLECLEDNLPVNKSCEYAKISKVTFYDWLKSDEEFRTQVEFSKSKGERRLVKAVEKKDPWKILKNVDRENFKEHQEIEHKGIESIIIGVGDEEEEI